MDDLTRERYTNPWWVTPDPATDDSELMQGIRRVALSESIADLEEETS